MITQSRVSRLCAACLLWLWRWWLEVAQVQRGGRIDGVAQGRVCGLHGQVSQQHRVGLDAVALLVIVGGVQELPGEVGPLASHALCTHMADVHKLLLQSQHPPCVCPLLTHTHIRE